MAKARQRWLGNRDTIARTPDGRRFVDEILARLADSRYSPSGWATFLGRSLARSAAQARIRPLALGEVTAIHLLAGAAGGRRWAAASWFVCVTHLGLLGDLRTLGWPNRLTLLRALLPALAPGSRWTSLVALATDYADGYLARRGAESAFGAFADPIADGVFWSWYALRWERSRWLGWFPLAVFVATMGAISTAYFVQARTIDYPRPILVRYWSGAAQFALALRTLRFARQKGRDRLRADPDSRRGVYAAGAGRAV